MTAFPSSILSSISNRANPQPVSGYLKKAGVHVDVAKVTVTTAAAVGNYIALTRLPASAKLIEIWRRGPAAGAATHADIGVYQAIDWVNSTSAQQLAAKLGSQSCIASVLDLNVNALPTGAIACIAGASTNWNTTHAVYGNLLDAPLWAVADVAMEPRPGTMYDIAAIFNPDASYTATRVNVFFILYSLGL